MEGRLIELYDRQFEVFMDAVEIAADDWEDSRKKDFTKQLVDHLQNGINEFREMLAKQADKEKATA